MTPFKEVYEEFYPKIMKKQDYFIYNGLTTEEIRNIIEDRNYNLLKRSIGELVTRCVPEVNFYDFDKNLGCFKFDITLLEKDILSDLMTYLLMNEDKVELNVRETWFNPKEISTFSPANERKTFLEMLDKMNEDIQLKISGYESKDRITGKPKTLNYNLGV